MCVGAFCGVLIGVSKAMASSVADRTSGSDRRVTINLRIEAHDRQLIDDAALVLGRTRTEFMIDSARRQAIDVLLDQPLVALDDARDWSWRSAGFVDTAWLWEGGVGMARTRTGYPADVGDQIVALARSGGGVESLGRGFERLAR